MRLEDCDRCPLHKVRTQVVKGVGPMDTPMMIVGQNPGTEEDKTGESFVGKAGAKLNEKLELVGMPRSKVRITNSVKCHTLNNRKPNGTELERCMPWLAKEIKRIKPVLILTLGDTALTQLTGLQGITKWRGEMFLNTTHNIFIFAMLHPASIMYPSAPDDEGFTRRDHWNNDWEAIGVFIGLAKEKGWNNIFDPVKLKLQEETEHASNIINRRYYAD